MSRVEISSLPILGSLPIVETFHSVQGEGYWTGTNAFFIRLGGCDVGCPWCDTKISWNAQRHPKKAIEALVQEALAVNPRVVIITGGEPLLHDLVPLTIALKAAGLTLHLETSGAYPLRGMFDWITLSPKSFKPPQAELYPLTNELKVVIAQTEDLEWAETQSNAVEPQVWRYLQPEWSNPQAIEWVYDYVLKHPHWRISLQTHKVLSVR